MLSPRPPQGVAATTGAHPVRSPRTRGSASHPGRRARRGASSDKRRPPPRKGRAARRCCGSCRPRPARGSRPEAARSRSRVPAPASRPISGRSDRPTRSRRFQDGEGSLRSQAMVAIVAQVSEVLGQADQQRPGGGGLTDQLTRTLEVGLHVLGRGHLNRAPTALTCDSKLPRRLQAGRNPTKRPPARPRQRQKTPKILRFSPSAAVLRTADQHVIKRGLERLRCLRNRWAACPPFYCPTHFCFQTSCEGPPRLVDAG